MKQTFDLLNRILAFKHGYMTGQTQKITIDLSQYPDAKIEDIYNYISKDNLLRIFWEENKFLIAKFD